MMEPALEALHYTYPRHQITVYGTVPLQEVQPLFEGHPLGFRYLEYSKYYDDTHDLIFTLDGYAKLRPHLVHQYAYRFGVHLLRDTPSLGNYRHTHSLVAKAAVTDILDPAVVLAFPATWNLYTLHPDYILPLKIEIIKKAEIFVGSDPLNLQIAHAAGVRKIIGVYPDGIDHRLTSYPGMQIVQGANSERQLRHAIITAVEEEKYPAFLNQGNACDFIKNTALQYCRGYGLDVGSNRKEWALPGALPSDADSRKFDQGPFDYIFSSHCLEHIKEWEKELQIWDKALRPGGVMFLYCPHPAMEMWHPEGDWVKGGWHVHSPEPVELVLHLNQHTNLKVERYTTYPDPAWGFYIVARKI